METFPVANRIILLWKTPPFCAHFHFCKRKIEICTRTTQHHEHIVLNNIMDTATKRDKNGSADPSEQFVDDVI